MELYKLVKYHSTDWQILVEIGYITMYVNSENIATMLYHKNKQ